MAAITIWLIEIPIVQATQLTQGYLLLEDGNKITLEDSSGSLQQEGAASSPLRDSDKTQLLIGCTLSAVQNNDIDYFRRYLNDKGVAA